LKISFPPEKSGKKWKGRIGIAFEIYFIQID